MSRTRAELDKSVERVVSLVWGQVEVALNEIDGVVRKGKQEEALEQGSTYILPREHTVVVIRSESGSAASGAASTPEYPHQPKTVMRTFSATRQADNDESGMRGDAEPPREMEAFGPVSESREFPTHAPTPSVSSYSEPAAFVEAPLSRRSPSIIVRAARPLRLASRLSSVQWYVLVYNAVTRYFEAGVQLYRRLETWVEAYMRRTMANFSAGLQEYSGSSSDMLYAWTVQEFGYIFEIMRFSTLIFGYLDAYVVRRAKLISVSEMFGRGFHGGVYLRVKDKVLHNVLKDVDSLRRGETVDIYRLKNAVDIFNRAGASVCTKAREVEEKYKSDFLDPYVAALRKYYSNRSVQRQSDVRAGRLTSGGYLEWAEEQLALEQSICDKFLRLGVFESAIRQKLQDSLITMPQKFVCDETLGMKPLLMGNADVELRRLYKLIATGLTDRRGRIAMVDTFERHVVELGGAAAYAFRSSDPVVGLTHVERAYMEQLIALHHNSRALVKSSFGSDNDFFAAIDRSWAIILKVPLYRQERKGGVESRYTTNATEVLVSYVDSVMRDEYKDVQTPAIEEKRLDFLARLAASLVEKDVFEEMARAKLAKRVLSYGANDEMERLYLSKLRTHIDLNFTRQMEAMLADCEKGVALSSEFAASSEAAGLPFAFDVHVLCASRWPPYKSDGLTPPPPVLRCVDAFTKFYKRTNKSKKLLWIHMLGGANLRLNFPKGAKEVLCTTTQASILMLVDNHGSISVRNVAQTLGLDAARIAKPQIASMLLSKQFAVLAVARGREAAPPTTVEDDDELCIDRGFTCKMRKFRLPLPTLRPTRPPPSSNSESASGTPATAQDTANDEILARRHQQIDCAIVRVLKSRRTVRFDEIVSTVLAQTSNKFPADAKMVKIRFEELMTRGYAKRCGDDGATFEYLA